MSSEPPRRPSDTLRLPKEELARLVEEARKEAEERDSAVLRARAAAAFASKFDDDECPTLTTCLACGGEWEKVLTRDNGTYCVIACPDCTRGGMSPTQIRAWTARRQGRPPEKGSP